MYETELHFSDLFRDAPLENIRYLSLIMLVPMTGSSFLMIYYNFKTIKIISVDPIYNIYSLKFLYWYSLIQFITITAPNMCFMIVALLQSSGPDIYFYVLNTLNLLQCTAGLANSALYLIQKRRDVGRLAKNMESQELSISLEVYL